MMSYFDEKADFEYWQQEHGLEGLAGRVRLDVVRRAGEILYERYFGQLISDRVDVNALQDVRVVAFDYAGEGRVGWRLLATYKDGRTFGKCVDVERSYLGDASDEDLETIRKALQKMLGWWDEPGLSRGE